MPEQKELLVPDEPVGYYKAWMSRSRFYLAPRDVQGKVVCAWREWIRTNAGSFRLASQPAVFAP
ncbi:hypothetical protein ACFL59_12150 [Planctomycetota bacterium]